MSNEATSDVKLTAGDPVRLRFGKQNETLIHVEYLDGTRAWVPMNELETLRKAFRFVEPPPRA